MELVNNGLDINMQSKNGVSLICIASSKGQTETVGTIICCLLVSLSHGFWLVTLVETGADVNLQRINGSSPIFIASQNGHTETVGTDSFVSLDCWLCILLSCTGEGRC